MHDLRGKELKVGDEVLIVAKIVELHPMADYCNVAVETKFGRRPDGQKERFLAFNTGVLLSTEQ
jgi:hypothetical protein